jgi:hypothetical protein
MHSKAILLLFSLLLFNSCSRNLSYFTDRLNEEFDWSESELKQIQFYISEDIKLVRVSQEGISDIENGQIKIQDKRTVDHVLIEKGTPGTLLFAKAEDRFAVCFDEDPEKYLMFGANKKAKGRYVLLAKKWNKGDGIIRYGGQEYRTSSESAYAALMVDINNARRSSKSSSRASGRKIK